ncbi:uncharacterized protein LOC122798818 [Protopterus annectens]|uniref:uncharacterized protein LOC122798818 n=1 Tax=Protopterus annectens TaxID=7888 RepID=UPI001CFB086B|nr:uncharacterized protein LOC122798818 [Protopterus annectens]
MYLKTDPNKGSEYRHANKRKNHEDDERSTGKKRNKICNHQSNRGALWRLLNSRHNGSSLGRRLWKWISRHGRWSAHQRQKQKKREQCHSLQGELHEQKVQKCKWSCRLSQWTKDIIQSEFSKRINSTDSWQCQHQGALRRLLNSRHNESSLGRRLWKWISRHGRWSAHQRQKQKKREQCHSLQGELHEQKVQKRKWSCRLSQWTKDIIQSEFSKRINSTNSWQCKHQGEADQFTVNEEEKLTSGAPENDKSSIMSNSDASNYVSSENEDNDPSSANAELKLHSPAAIKCEGQQNGNEQSPHQSNEKEIAEGHHNQSSNETQSTSGHCTGEGSVCRAVHTNYTQSPYELLLHSKQTVPTSRPCKPTVSSPYYEHYIQNMHDLSQPSFYPRKQGTDCAKEKSASPSSKSSDRK